MIRSHDQRVIPLSIRRGTNAREMASFKLSGLYFCADNRIGPLHDPVTWYKITYTGEQVAQWDLQNNALAFVLEVPLRDLLTSIFNFAPCDRVVQRAYWTDSVVAFNVTLRLHS